MKDPCMIAKRSELHQTKGPFNVIFVTNISIRDYKTILLAEHNKLLVSDETY